MTYKLPSTVDVGILSASTVEVALCHDGFQLSGVTIGKDFHWEKKETQEFHGKFILKCDGDNILVINRVPIETYLESVISSEMNPNASLELLKAHAVISRSWLMARICPQYSYGIIAPPSSDSDEMIDSEEEHITWYDTAQHSGFDVCADDHCQRYQGLTRIANHNAIEAVRATKGELLVFDGKICDARFSKCCGGTMEIFENCWQPVNHPYLQSLPDKMSSHQTDIPQLKTEIQPFCNTKDERVLRQVLNDYDTVTNDFFRWTKEYCQEELARIIKARSGIDFGKIIDIKEVKRGPSGRLVKAKIIATNRTLTIGKELEIRKWLSTSHLYSSAFTVERHFDGRDQKIPSRFTLHGKGWGHGVGLCQIGAAMMAQRGYDYRDILSHYYPGAKIDTILPE